MIGYTQSELDGNWEFKIVRANRAVFHKPGELAKLISEEARAGWILLEKFNDQFVRFKRPYSARDLDSQLPSDVDPYRTYYGMSPTRYAAFVAGLVVVIAIGMIVAATLCR